MTRPSIRHGGLMRCCLVTFHDLAERDVLPKAPGGTIPCAYCSNHMILASDGVWEWAGKPVKPPKVGGAR